jgi:rhamnosyltransferase
MSRADLSVIIRTKNEESNIANCLSSIFAQKTSYQLEILIVDSGSADRTLDIASRFPVKIINIPPGEFTYGHALNIGVINSLGKYCVFISGDAYPAKENWLDELITPFGDPLVASVSGGQLPILGLNPIEEVALLKMFPNDSSHKVMSAANCAIRKDLLVKYPFIEKVGNRELGNKPTPEDLVWRLEIESLGYKTVYLPQAAVFHSHPFVKFIRKVYWDHFYTGYYIAYYGKTLYFNLPEKSSLFRRIPKTIRYMNNSLRYLIKRGYYMYIPIYLLFMVFSFLRVFQGYYKGLSEIKNV